MKTSKFNCLRIVALIIVMAQLISISTVVAFASTDDAAVKQEETIIQDEFTYDENTTSIEQDIVEYENDLNLVVGSTKIISGERAEFDFDRTNVLSYNYICDGVAVTEKDNSPMQFEIEAVDQLGCVDIYANYKNGQIIKKSIYTYKDGNTTYLSDVSVDRAWYNCMEEKYNNEEISLE